MGPLGGIVNEQVPPFELVEIGERLGGNITATASLTNAGLKGRTASSHTKLQRAPLVVSCDAAKRC